MLISVFGYINLQTLTHTKKEKSSAEDAETLSDTLRQHETQGNKFSAFPPFFLLQDRLLT